VPHPGERFCAWQTGPTCKQDVPMSPPTSDATPDETLFHVLRARAKAPESKRITALVHRGRRYWIKRIETLPLRWRLQKGNPARRFAHERAVLREMASRGAPVPPILAEGRDWFALPDCGASLETLVRRHDHPDRLRAVEHAGMALAGLHGMGLKHGRPHPRDLCWDGTAIRFIDFERGSARPASRRARALDIVIMTHALYAMDLHDHAAVDAFCAGYRRGDSDRLWQRTEALCRRLRWLEPLSRPIQRFEARKHRAPHFTEWQAFPLTLRRFGA
jgi:tRNA A-37 threonylcarbamoyl transferase component Bud32